MKDKTREELINELQELRVVFNEVSRLLKITNANMPELDKNKAASEKAYSDLKAKVKESHLHYDLANSMLQDMDKIKSYIDHLEDRVFVYDLSRDRAYLK